MPMRRRDVLQAGGAAALAAFLPGSRAQADTFARVRPGMPDWPSDADWSTLRHRLGDRLIDLRVFANATPPDAAQARNPFYRRDRPDLTQSAGWVDAWQAAPPVYAVAAETAADVAAAVRFAAEKRLRVAVRGGGHSYFGTSCAPDSLLIWTRRMDAITVHPAFVPEGGGAPPVPAVSLGAGCIWLHAYQAVTGGAGRYVQGGGCTTVGVAGHVLGGGFGSFSKAYGLAAASLLEAEIVTADGAVRIVNATREPDLFWALKGGGGGTFGVVTRLTLATHPLPDTFGVLTLRLQASSEDAYKRLVSEFMTLYAQRMFNPHWGEQARFGPDNVLRLQLLFQGIDKTEARATIEPLLAFARTEPAIGGADSLSISTLPARYLWNAWLLRLFARSAVEFDSRAGASWTDFWWSGDADQTGAFWNGYGSAWLPAGLLEEANRAALVEALFAASRHWTTALHFNKGLAGAPPDVLAAARDTAINPDVLSAFALAISATSRPVAPAGASEEQAARDRAARVNAAIAALRAVAPDTGAYVNECDFFQDDWQRRFWGPHYARLLAIKTRVDPDGLFVVHHGVGSEPWSADGFTRTP